MDIIEDLNNLRSVEELSHYESEVHQRMTNLNLEYAGVPLPEDARGEFATLKEQSDEIAKRLRELEARNRVIEQLDSRDGNRERESDRFFESRDSRGSMKERDIYDLSTIRADITDPGNVRAVLHDRAKRALDISVFPHVRDQARAKEHIERLLEFDSADGEIAKRMLATGSPTYRRAFTKWLFGRGLSDEEQRAMALGTGSAGGYAIVYQLDPTFVPTSNLAVNPFRAISDVTTIAGTNEWRGVTSGAITAAYATEGTEASDNSPTLAQPDLVVQRAQAFVPVSIELSQDLPALQGELAKLIQDAKDVLEASEFTTGSGTAPHPQGVLTGATNIYTSAGTAAFAVGDVYGLEGALGPRFRPNASFVGNRAIYNLVRQFDTNGGANMWVGYPNPLQGGLANNPPTGGGLELRLIGYPAYEDSQMVTALTSGNQILILGDFRYYKIVDRIGLDVEVIPHLFGASNRYPTGQRGIYAMWRNTARVLSAAAFQVLQTK